MNLRAKVLDMDKIDYTILSEILGCFIRSTLQTDGTDKMIGGLSGFIFYLLP
jgi:hypothetical protein